MTQNQKYMIGGAAALVVGYLIFGRSSDNGGPAEDPTGNTGSSGSGGYVFNAARVAAELLQAMDRWGTDEDAILASLTHVSQSQFAQVSAAFGNQPYNDNTGDSSGLFDLPHRSLKYWLYNELSEENYGTLKRKYPNFL